MQKEKVTESEVNGALVQILPFEQLVIRVSDVGRVGREDDPVRPVISLIILIEVLHCIE